MNNALTTLFDRHYLLFIFSKRTAKIKISVDLLVKFTNGISASLEQNIN